MSSLLACTREPTAPVDASRCGAVPCLAPDGMRANEAGRFQNVLRNLFEAGPKGKHCKALAVDFNAPS
jgi:hypothetical protein